MHKRTLVLAVVAALAVLGLVYAQRASQAPGACDFCQRSVCQGTAYTVHLSFGRTKHACCPRCGIQFEKEHPGTARRTTVKDFATGKELRAQDAVFVEGSDFSHCKMGMMARDQEGASFTVCYDRCMPSVVAFADRKGAEEFESAHGGKLISFDQLLRE
jgi:hypothetical protein